MRQKLLNNKAIVVLSALFGLLLIAVVWPKSVQAQLFEEGTTFSYSTDYSNVDSQLGDQIITITGPDGDTLDPGNFVYCGESLLNEWLFFDADDLQAVSQGQCEMAFTNWWAIVVDPAQPNSGVFGKFIGNQGNSNIGGFVDQQSTETLEADPDITVDDEPGGNPDDPPEPTIPVFTVLITPEVLQTGEVYQANPSIRGPDNEVYTWCLTSSDKALFAKGGSSDCLRSGVDNVIIPLTGGLNKATFHLQGASQGEEIRLVYDPQFAPGEEEEASLRCENQPEFALIPFRFILCSVIGFMFSAINNLYQNFVLPLLDVKPLDREGDVGQQTIYNIWNDIRILANLTFIVVFLVAIMGQAFGWILTPYELKKILPRLLVGAIGIQLSWFFVGFMVDVFNVLGAGIRALMLAPLEGLKAEYFFNFESSAKEFLSILGIGALGTSVLIGVTATSLFSGLPLILFPIVMALVFSVLTIVLRIALINILIIVSPLAFVAWVLPNTANITATWWGYLWKALFVYPLIVALIASGEFLARIIGTSGGGPGGQVSNGWEAIGGMIALFAPFFLIPFVFRFAGGAIAAISSGGDGFSQNLNKRIFGDERTPNTYRFNRKRNQEQRKDLKKFRTVDRLANAGPENSRRRKAGGWAAKRMMNLGHNAIDRLGERRIEAYDFLRSTVTSGRDEVFFALISGNCTHPISGKPLQQDGCDAAERLISNGLYRDEFLMEAAVYYAMTKGVPGDQWEKARKSFMNNDRIPRGMRRQRGKIWDRVANDDRVLYERPDLRIRHYGENEDQLPDVTLAGRAARGEDVRETADLELRESSEWLNEHGSRFGPAYAARFMPSSWKAANFMLDGANDIKARATAEAEAAGDEPDDWNSDKYLSAEERIFLARASEFRTKAVGARESGPEGSNQIVQQMREPEYEWLVDYELPGGMSVDALMASSGYHDSEDPHA